MSDVAPVSCSSELHHTPSTGLQLSKPDSGHESYLLNAVTEPEDTPDMEPTSPTSPMSTVSPTASERSLTPTSPSPSPFKSFWMAPRGSKGQTLPRLILPSIQSPSRPKTTLQCILESPSKPSIADQLVQSGSLTSSLRARRASRNRRVTALKTPQTASADLDQDGDVMMLSPPIEIPRRNAWTELQSPILGRLIGSPQKHVSETADEAEQSSFPVNNTKEQEAQADSQSCDLPFWSGSSFRFRSQSASQTHDQGRRRSQTPKTNGTSRPTHPPTTKLQSRRRSSTAKPPSRIQTQLQNSITHLATPLVPLISVTTGLPHPSFPRSILQYHLLTHAQLDSLAQWYHQTIDNHLERYMYPAAIARPWVCSADEPANDSQIHPLLRIDRELEGDRDVSLNAKRRRFGRFIGLRGCESPVVSSDQVDQESGESVAERMEREWRAVLRRAEEEERLREKVWRGRW